MWGHTHTAAKAKNVKSNFEFVTGYLRGVFSQWGELSWYWVGGWFGGEGGQSLSAEKRTSKAKSCIRGRRPLLLFLQSEVGGTRGGGFSQVSPGQGKDRFASPPPPSSSSAPPAVNFNSQSGFHFSPSLGAGLQRATETKRRGGGETVQATTTPLTPEKTVKAF